MRKLLSRPGMAPAVAGLAILVQAVLARVLLQADETRVYVLGHALDWVCALRARFGLPCPTCGLTRSVILTLHGQVSRAWHVAPGGPPLTLGVLLVALGILALAAVELSSNRAAGDGNWLEKRMKTGLQTGALAWAGISTVVWLAGWVSQFSAALQAMH